MNEDQNALWDDLLDYIEAGLVLPIVGQDLARVTVDGREARLYDHLAVRLAKELGMNLEPSSNGLSLADVAGRYIAQDHPKAKVHIQLNKILKDQESFPIPDLLLKLAGIKPFKLMVTTTFDIMLERALNEARFGGNDKTASFTFAPDDAKDLEAFKELDRPTVFHLLGRVSAKPHYAVTDDDVLEFVHALQLNTKTFLFDELRDKHLLFIGCAFPDWLTRFLIRTARGKRLKEAEPSLTVADERVRSDDGLVFFLEHFSNKGTTVFRGTAAEFVDELHKRWTAAHGTAATVDADVTQRGTVQKSAPDGAVFLSYASEDLEAARAIRDALEGVGVDVWFDKDDLEGGDAYEAKIRGNIESCSLFVPIISHHTTTPKRRFFRLEWTEAQEVAKKAPESSRFVLPVVIDDTSYDEETIPTSFRGLHWTSLPKGRPTDDFVNRIKSLYRDYRKTMTAAL